MSREGEIATLLLADAEMVTLTPGGIYTDETLGVEGIRRGEGSPTEDAFDVDGYLKTCVLVKQRSEVPYGDIRVSKEKITATSQVVEIYFYEFRGHSEIDAAKDRAYEILENERLDSSYPIMWVGETAHVPDVGPVMNSTTLRQDWQIISIKKPT